MARIIDDRTATELTIKIFDENWVGQLKTGPKKFYHQGINSVFLDATLKTVKNFFLYINLVLFFIKKIALITSLICI